MSTVSTSREKIPELTPFGEFVRGAVASAVMMGSVQPLSTMRTLRMNGLSAFSLVSKQSPFQTVRSYFRGIKTNLMQTPTVASVFVLNALFKTEERENLITALSLSGLSGALPGLYVNLFDHVITRQQLKGETLSKTINIITENGKRWRSLARGSVTTMTGQALFSMGLFALPPQTTSCFMHILPKGKNTERVASILGKSSAAAIVGFLSTPVDSMRSRIHGGEFRGVIEASAEIYRKNLRTRKLIRELFRGGAIRTTLVGSAILVAQATKTILQDRMPSFCYQEEYR